MKCLLSPPNIHILKITSRANSKLRFIHLIKVLKKRRRMNRVKVKTPWQVENVFIRTHSKRSAYYHLWTYIFWRSICEQIPSQYFSILSKLWKINKNDRVQRRTKKWIQTSYHKNTLKINFLLSLLKINLMKIAFKPNSRPVLINLIHFWTTRRRIDGCHRKTAPRIKIYLIITSYSQLRNTVPLRSYWSDKWIISQVFITIPYL